LDFFLYYEAGVISPDSSGNPTRNQWNLVEVECSE